MKTYVRRRNYRRTRKTKAGSKPFVRKVTRIARNIVSRNTEVKRFMSSNTTIQMSTILPGANWIQFAASIARGTGSSDRIGDKIKIIGIKFDLILYNSTLYNVWVRQSIIRPSDKQILDPLSNIFMGTNNQTTNLNSLIGLPSIIRKFHPNTVSKVYKDKVTKLPGTAATEGDFFKRQTFFQKFGKGLTVTFNANNLGVTNQEPNIAWGIWCADIAGSGIARLIDYTYQYTIFFTDA